MALFDDTVTQHESFGLLGFSRVQCSGGVPLFGSDIEHSTFIKMTLQTAEMKRGLNHNWYHSDKRIAEVTMSQNQFAELITSMNMGDGIPVTINYTQEFGNVVTPKFETVTDQHRNEFKQTVKKVGADAKTLEARMKEILGKSGTVKKADREELLNMILHVAQDINSNMPYMEQTFVEVMDKVVTDAKGTVEAFYQHRVTEAGIGALSADGQAPRMLEQPSQRKLINIAGENAYYHCGDCGMELLGEEVGECAAARTTASGELANCPKCAAENTIIWDRE